MLKHLYIKNYALIKELDIDLKPGFSVITGETGAGKSIILGAISLILGQKADSKSIMPGEEKCIIEATFSVGQYNLESLFEEYDIDYDSQECIIRRELSQSGKSRAFVNDSPANVAFLKELGYHLIDIHSQHQNLLLAKEDYQMGVVDTVARNADALALYRTKYKALKEAETALQEMKEELEKARTEQDYLIYQYEQLEAFNPKEGEDETLSAEQNELSHAEDIKTALYQVSGLFSNDTDNGGMLDYGRTIGSILQNLTSIYPAAEDYAQRIDNALIELKDINDDISRMADNIEYNPQRLEEVNTRLDMLYSLEQKHSVDSSDALRNIMEDMRKKLDGITDGDFHIREMEEKIAILREEATIQAGKLTKERAKAAKAIESFVKQNLTRMDMPNNNFIVQISPCDELSANGADKVSFMFSANKNAPLREISQVASGGEIARVMLTLKAMTAQMTELPTIVFDEIDTGVSGKVADSMADIMSAMGRGEQKQVIAITHLPQIAAKGDTHYWVYKKDSKEQTFSHIKVLSDEERTEEIAHMLSGSVITDAAMENARQLLQG